MTLVAMQWTRVSLHNVMLAWLRAERHKLAGPLSAFPPLVWSSGVAMLLDKADLNNAEENRARLRLFYMIRSLYFVELPPDTEWYEVHNLTDSELSELLAVNHQDWIDAADRNELAKVAARKNLPLRTQPATWEPPILWGHDRAGPFTILEGNNRLAAYVLSGQSGLKIPVFVGLSPLACVFHILDKCNFLMQDLIRR
jgi:hypothetical protein